MILSISYWAWIGTIMLIYMTWQDYKNHMMVDERKNWFMAGVSYSLLSHLPRSIWYVLSLLIVAVLENKFLSKFQVLGRADITAITWITFGYGYLSPYNLFAFFVIFSVASLIYILSKKYIFKHMEKTPFFYVMLISFVMTNLAGGLY